MIPPFNAGDAGLSIRTKLNRLLRAAVAFPRYATTAAGVAGGRCYPPSSAPKIVNATATPIAGKVYAHLISIAEAQTISALGLKTAGAGSTPAATKHLFAIYRADGPNGNPGTRMGYTATLNIASGTVNQSYDLPLVSGGSPVNVALDADNYYLLSTCDTTNAINYATIDNAGFTSQAQILGGDSFASVINNTGLVTGKEISRAFSDADPTAAGFTYPTSLSGEAWIDHVTGRLAAMGVKVVSIP